MRAGSMFTESSVRPGADRALLFNAEHPSPDDPLHHFGVDDGTGCFDGTNRWYFINAFIVRGQWKQFIQAGIRTLSLAYAMSGDRVSTPTRPRSCSIEWPIFTRPSIT